MKNSDYWKQRFMQLEDAHHSMGLSALTEIEKQYKAAQKELDGQIALWYQKFADNNGITMADAQTYLQGAALKEFKWDVKEYIKYGKENALMGGWTKELENASAKYHITKLEALKIHTQHSLESLCSSQLHTVYGTMTQVLETGYYHTTFELQKGFNIGWDIAALNQTTIEHLLSKPWSPDKYNFSEKIWSNKNKLIAEVHKQLSLNIMTGADPQNAIDAIAKAMKSSKKNAGRLVMTEEAYFSSLSRKECFENLGVEEYEVVATLDEVTSDICRSLDGKVFPVKDFQAGVTAPPFHPWCRSTTAPKVGDDFGKIGERAARDESTGKTYYIPDDIKYPEWEKTFVKGGDKSGFDVFDADGTIHYKHHENDVDNSAESDIIKEDSEAYKFMLQQCNINNVEHKSVHRLSKRLSSEEIIKKLAGGDMTKGSCSSLAFAYIGNQNGLDVIDFRGGNSQHVFSSGYNIEKMFELPGVRGSITKAKKEISGTIDVLKNIESNKEYYLATGKHAAIVRRTDSGLEYLELQSKVLNGWMPFDRYGSTSITLNKRFGCRKTVDKTRTGFIREKSIVLMEVDSFKDNKEFQEILGYINTAVDAQQKGAMGDVK